MSMNGRTVSFLPRHHDSLPTGFVPANIIPRIGLIRKAIKRIQRVILNKIQHIRLDPFTHALANRPGMYDIQQTIHKTFISGNHTRSQVKIFLQYLIHTILLFYRIQTYTISKLLACVYILTSRQKIRNIFIIRCYSLISRSNWNRIRKRWKQYSSRYSHLHYFFFPVLKTKKRMS